MTTTINDRVAALRGLADHIERYNLDASDILRVGFNDIDWDGIAVQVHRQGTFAAWMRTLDEVTATGHENEGTIHVHAAGSCNDFAVQVNLVFSSDRTPHLYEQLTRQKLGGQPFNFEPIELPECLGGAR